MGPDVYGGRGIAERESTYITKETGSLEVGLQYKT